MIGSTDPTIKYMFEKPFVSFLLPAYHADCPLQSQRFDWDVQLVQGSIETTHPESWNIVGSKVSRATKYETDDSGMTRKVSYDVTYEISFDRFKITFIGDIINGYYFSWECANDQSLAGQTITVIKCIYVKSGQGCYTLFINLKAANE